jgi:hypothetical protein
MLVVGAILALLLVAAGLQCGTERRPLDRHEMQRVRRFSERLHKEATCPFD